MNRYSLKEAKAKADNEGWADWILSEQDERAAMEGFYFDHDSALRAINFFQNAIVLPDDERAGEPFVLIDWQYQLVAQIYGWKDDEGYRRFKRVSVWVPKKQGKTPLGAAFALYHLIDERNQMGRIYNVATEREQALVLLQYAMQMVRESPIIEKRCKILESKNEIRCGSAIAKALSGETKSSEGKNASLMLIDELHVVHDQLFNSLRYAGRARRDSLLITKSTAGNDLNSIGKNQFDHAVDVRDGRVIDLRFLPCIYAIEDGEDWKNEEVIRRVNPSVGVTVQLSSLLDDRDEAIHNPRMKNAFLRYTLNRWVGGGDQWLNMEEYDQNCEFDEDARPVPVKFERMIGRNCCAALDLGWTNDLTAFVLISERDDDSNVIDVYPRFWCAEGALHDEKNKNRFQYQQWVDEGLLEATPGTSTNHDIVREDIVELLNQVHLFRMQVDNSFAGSGVCKQLAEELGEEIVLGFPQTYNRYTAPMLEFERRIKCKQFNHGGHPILSNNANETTVIYDRKKMMMPEKTVGKKEAKQIDGVVAWLMALDAFLCMPERIEAPGMAFF